MNPILWSPSSKFKNSSHLQKYINWLEDQKDLEFGDYDDLWQWSVDRIEDFWESIWQYFDVKAHTPYRRVLSGQMPGARWFEGSTLNYAEHIFRHQTDDHPAIIFYSERREVVTITWAELHSEVASMAAFLKSRGVKKGDTVAAFLPNIPQATIAFLATCSIGAIWSSCSPDFGASSVVDRFAQIAPKVFFTVESYSYNGKIFDKRDVVSEITKQLPSLETVIVYPYIDTECSLESIFDAKASSASKARYFLWEETRGGQASLDFTPVPFDHPIYVLYSSGTTGKPKAITHSHGGNLLEHLKYLHFHNDVHPGERFFWFSTTGWMMWNFVHASFLAGATIVLYDGSPGYPDLDVLWEFSEVARITHFGTSAPFLTACQKNGHSPGNKHDLSAMRSLSSTGSPLPPEAFDYVYNQIKSDVWLCSMAGGTDVCTAWVGGVPFKPVIRGEIQGRSLGAALEAWDEAGHPVIGDVGELVVTKPMPSMPVFFWGDENYNRYRSSYFEMYPGIWRHGDWIVITETGGVIMTGRSDATLNRGGVRIGTAEIYRAMDKIPEIKDSLIVNLEMEDGDDFMPLFVVLAEGTNIDEALLKKIRTTLRTECSPRHLPDAMIECPDIPYTISGKKIEAPVKKVLMGIPLEQAANLDAMRNPGAMTFFVEFSKEMPRR